MPETRPKILYPDFSPNSGKKSRGARIYTPESTLKVEQELMSLIGKYQGQVERSLFCRRTIK